MQLQPFTVFDIDNQNEVCHVPEGACLLAYRGSIAHGMYVPSSDPSHIDDIDLMGVIIGKEENYLGLREWGSRGTHEHKEGKWDCVYYELRKFFSLLLQGNPNVLSLLWIRPEHYIYRTEAGYRITANRSLFVGKHVYNAFAGYAHAQLEKMETRDPVELEEYLAVTAELKALGIHPNHKGERFPQPERETGKQKDVAMWGADRLLARMKHFHRKGENLGYLGDKRKRLVLEHGYDAKNAAHCVRLLRMAREFLRDGEMDVYRENDRAELLDIKAGKWALSAIKQHAEELFAEIKIARDASPLPDEPNHKEAGDLLVSILRDSLRLARAN